MTHGAAIDLVDVNKTYGAAAVVDHVSLSIGAGEFVSLLGPSGSGKTTTLMMVAGFATPTSGRIIVDGEDVSRVPPRRRGFGMVFQNYSLFPHLNVFENIAFPLRLRRIPAAEIGSRVQRALDLVRLGGLGGRRVTQLSGGQQQRVALARAVVFEPRVVLMDEPLGALDKNLRFAMQTEIKEIQQRLGMTVLYVTHDQEEAMNMSDRIAIMNHGEIEQVGAPQEVYDRPQTAFVGTFLGEANLLAGEVVGVGAELATIRLADGALLRAPPSPAVREGMRASLFVRPERLSLSPEAEPAAGMPHNSLAGSVIRCSFLGSFRRYAVEIATGEAVSVDQPNTQATAPLRPGERAVLHWSPHSGQVLGAAS